MVSIIPRPTLRRLTSPGLDMTSVTGPGHQEFNLSVRPLPSDKPDDLARRLAAVLRDVSAINGSSLLTLLPSLHCRRQTVRHMRPASHVQPLRNPFQRHNAFPPQAQRYLHLLRIALAPLHQICFLPFPTFQFLRHDPLRLLLARFLPFRPIMTLPDPRPLVPCHLASED